MEAIFHAPKRRARVYECFESPLPVVYSSDPAALQHSGLHRADTLNQHVVVRSREHIRALYSRGYFGKGVLSRSRPEHSISRRWEHVGDKYLPVVSMETYRRHVRWAHATLLAQGLDEDDVRLVLQNLADPIPLDLREECRDDNMEEGEEPQEAQAAARNVDTPDEDQDLESSLAKRPRRQGDPRYDPLAELYPQKPEHVEQSALARLKCRRRDDWILHCGCRADEGETSKELSVPTAAGQEYVLVEEADEDEESQGRSERLVCRVNPFNMIEYLQLGYEEAFFLIYALGCLSLYHQGEPLSVLQAWELFRSAQPNFAVTYAAYHYFRSKGWVPKTGIKYGTDFLLYRKGPPFYHASYSVVVERTDESLQGAVLRPFTWRSLAALNRTTANVSKELMLCYVIMPCDLTEDDLSSPEFLKRVRVQELIVSRWVSSRERTEQDEM